MPLDSTMTEFGNVLLIQLGDIGDVVLTTPTIRAVRETYPSARVSILVRRPFGNLLTADQNLYQIIEAGRNYGTLTASLQENLLLARRLRTARYDLVIALRTGDRSAILAFLTGAKVRIGRQELEKPFWYKHLFTRLLLNPPYAQPPVHPGADQSLRIVRALGIDTADSGPKLYLAPEDRNRALDLLRECGLTPGNRWVSINPCSRWKYKEWGYGKWAGIIDLLWQNHGLKAVLIGSPEEAGAAREIVASRKDRAFNLAGKTTLGELSALIAMSTLHLGVDSAAPHIAAAVGVPTLTVFGPGNWKSWTIEDELHRLVTAEIPCVPCNMKGCNDSEKSYCLDELSVDRVYAVAAALLTFHDIKK